MAQCIETALQRFPFATDQERERVVWNNETDFKFRGIELLMVHVLFNLIKNSLYHIAKAGKGRIFIHAEQVLTGNKLFFRDTGSGVPSDVLPHIFTQFYSWSPDNDKQVGAGIGLAFCSSVMTSFSGHIHCESQLGEYTEFILSFPSQPILEETK
jgi:two-component system CAI-1 autoinducer sensor kinase/phosphatase CqsS